jgi:hypothetical protein
MTTNVNPIVSLTDIDAVLAAEFEVMQPIEPDTQVPQAVRVVRCITTGQMYTFDTPQHYLQFVLSISPRRLLADVSGTRYIEISAQYDNDVYFHASVTYTVAALTQDLVVLHRMKSDETSVRFELTRAKMAALVSGYQSYLDDVEQEETEAEVARDPFLDFSDDLM